MSLVRVSMALVYIVDYLVRGSHIIPLGDLFYIHRFDDVEDIFEPSGCTGAMLT